MREDLRSDAFYHGRKTDPEACGPRGRANQMIRASEVSRLVDTTVSNEARAADCTPACRAERAPAGSRWPHQSATPGAASILGPPARSMGLLRGHVTRLDMRKPRLTRPGRSVLRVAIDSSLYSCRQKKEQDAGHENRAGSSPHRLAGLVLVVLGPSARSVGPLWAQKRPGPGGSGALCRGIWRAGRQPDCDAEGRRKTRSTQDAERRRRHPCRG